MQYGPFYPSMVTSEPYVYNGAPWTNPGPVLREPQGVDAVATIIGEGASDYLRVTGFCANIPNNKTISEVRLELPNMVQGGNLFNNSEQFIVGPLGEIEASVALPYIRMESDNAAGLTPEVVNSLDFGFKFAVYAQSGGIFVVKSLAMYVEVN